jgi:hypothetical protein
MNGKDRARFMQQFRHEELKLPGVEFRGLKVLDETAVSNRHPLERVLEQQSGTAKFPPRDKSLEVRVLPRCFDLWQQQMGHRTSDCVNWKGPYARRRRS